MIRDMLAFGGLAVAAVSGWVIEPAAAGVVIGAGAFLLSIIVMRPAKR